MKVKRGFKLYAFHSFRVLGSLDVCSHYSRRTTARSLVSVWFLVLSSFCLLKLWICMLFFRGVPVKLIPPILRFEKD